MASSSALDELREVQAGINDNINDIKKKLAAMAGFGFDTAGVTQVMGTTIRSLITPRERLAERYLLHNLTGEDDMINHIIHIVREGTANYTDEWTQQHIADAIAAVAHHECNLLAGTENMYDIEAVLIREAQRPKEIIQ